VTGRRAPSFRDLSVGETAALSPSKGIRSPASMKRDADKSQKRPAREPRNERKDSVIPFEEPEWAKMIQEIEIVDKFIRRFSYGENRFWRRN
jgi:hypothetical protein